MENNFTVLNKLLYLIKFLIMKLKGFTNLKLAELLESATNLFVNKKYQTKKEVENNLGLFIQRSYFYGKKEADGEYVALSLSKVVFNSDKDVQLVIEGIVVLPQIPKNDGDGDITYTGYGVLEVNGSVIYDGRGGATTSQTLQDVIDNTDNTTEATSVVNCPLEIHLEYFDPEVENSGGGIYLGLYDPQHRVYGFNGGGIYAGDLGSMFSKDTLTISTTNVPDKPSIIIHPRTLTETPSQGFFEFDGDSLYITTSTGRKQIALVS